MYYVYDATFRPLRRFRTYQEAFNFKILNSRFDWKIIKQ